MTLHHDIPPGGAEIQPPVQLGHLRDGGLVAIREVERRDAARLPELAMRAIYPGGIPSPVAPETRRGLQDLAAVDHREAECLLAVDPLTGAPVGIASYRPCDRHGCAEVDVLVRDGRRGRGAGTALLESLADVARSRGLHGFTKRVCAQDDRMLEMLDRLGADCREGHGDEVEVEVPLGDGEGLGAALGGALWAVARGGLLPVGGVMPPQTYV